MRESLRSEIHLENELVTIFKNNKFGREKSSDFELPPYLENQNLNFKPAAVLLPIVFDNYCPALVLTRREKNLRETQNDILKAQKEESICMINFFTLIQNAKIMLIC